MTALDAAEAQSRLRAELNKAEEDYLATAHAAIAKASEHV